MWRWQKLTDRDKAGTRQAKVQIRVEVQVESVFCSIRPSWIFRDQELSQMAKWSHLELRQ